MVTERTILRQLGPGEVKEALPGILLGVLLLMQGLLLLPSTFARPYPIACEW